MPRCGERPKHRGHPSNLVAVAVMGLATLSAYDANNVRQLRMNASFFPHLSNRRICRRFAWLDDAARQGPDVGVTIVHKQHATLLVSGNHHNGRHQNEVGPNLFAQCCDEWGCWHIDERVVGASVRHPCVR